MKFQVYSDKTIFENILLEKQKYINWNNILNHHSEVYIDMSQDDFDLDIADPDNSILFQYIQEAHGRAPIPNEQFFQDFENDNTIVLDNPFSAFFIDKDDQSVKDLSERYGLIFQNYNIDDEALTKTYFKNFVKGSEYKNQNSEGWNSLSLTRKYIFNALVITEEHLFHNEETVRGQRTNLGVYNLIGFLNLVLPDNLGIDFHLTVVTEMKNRNIPEIEAFDYYDQINQALGSLRPYNINFELVFTIETVHNRSAYSNYQVFTLDKGYKVFSVRDRSKVYEKNKLTLSQIFLTCKPEDGDTHFQEIVDDIPAIKKGIRNCTEYVRVKGNTFPNFKCFGFPSTLLSQNRLLNNFP